MKILVATDGSKPALNAITLISVHDDAGLRHAKAFVGSDVVADYLRELSEKEMKAARKLLDASGVKHDMEIRTGQPAQEIVARATTGKFDLIVLGSKGRGAMTDLLLGSVTNRVVATATQPVAVIK